MDTNFQQSQPAGRNNPQPDYSASAATSALNLILPLAHLNRVYCAGPLFNEAERDQMDRIAANLEKAGFETFVPHRDGMQLAELTSYLVSEGHDADHVQQWLLQAIFALDSFQLLERCGSLVFNCSGRVPDEGSVAETAMAWCTGKPVVYFKFGDVRSLVQGVDNPMLTGLAQFQTHTDIDTLGDAMQEKMESARPYINSQIPVPPHVAAAIQEGRTIWNAIESLTKGSTPAERTKSVGNLIVQLYGASDSEAA